MVEGKWGTTMMNIMEINGYRAIVQYDPDIEMFRGEYIGLNGGADFYGKDIESLRQEGEISLKVFLEMCQEDGVEPRREYSGRFNLRVSPQLHAEIATRAAAAGKSLNQWVADILDETLQVH
jgi:predicted HicB family RNase H-like nuclease